MSEGNERRGPLLDAVEQTLGQVFPGIEIVDRDLEVGEGRTADLVGLDRRGRLVLVLIALARDDVETLRAIDAAAFALREADLLREHYRGRGRAEVDPATAPVVAVVARPFPPVLAARLAGLRGELVRALELRSLRSSSGEALHLVVLGAPEEPPPRASEAGVQAFLLSLPPASRQLAEVLTRRVVRIDEELRVAVERGALVWRLSGRELCSLGLDGGELAGRVSGGAEPLRLAAPPDVERFLDRALGRYLVLLGGDEQLGAARPAPDPGELEDDDPPETPDVILTPEELAAFEQLG